LRKIGKTDYNQEEVPSEGKIFHRKTPYGYWGIKEIGNQDFIINKSLSLKTAVTTRIFRGFTT
jgi:hypothetical protein